MKLSKIMPILLYDKEVKKKAISEKIPYLIIKA